MGASRTGKEEDVEVGLVYFGKRFYAPGLGRWASADPLEIHAPGEADGNLYAYVSGRALQSVDPLGLQAAEKIQPQQPPPTPTPGGAANDNGKPGTPPRSNPTPPPGDFKLPPLTPLQVFFAVLLYERPHNPGAQCADAPGDPGCGGGTPPPDKQMAPEPEQREYGPPRPPGDPRAEKPKTEPKEKDPEAPTPAAPDQTGKPKPKKEIKRNIEVPEPKKTPGQKKQEKRDRKKQGDAKNRDKPPGHRQKTPSKWDKHSKKRPGAPERKDKRKKK